VNAKSSTAGRAIRIPLHVLNVLLAVFLLFGTEHGITIAQEPVAPARIRETVAIETDLTAQRQLELARVHLAEKRWKEGIDLVRQAAANSPASLVSVGPGRYLNVELYAQLLFSSLPPEGLAVIRQAIDGSARQTYGEAFRNRDADGLRSIVRDAFASRATEDALLTLGQWAWESGEITSARGNWERLIPLRRPTKLGALAPILRSPDSHFDRANILARLVMCSIVEGDFDRSIAERNAFRRMYPKATGQLAGKSGNLADLLDQIDGPAQSWSFPPRDRSVATFGVNACRNGVLPAEVDVGALRWAVDLPADPFMPTGAAASGREALTTFPVVHGDLLLANNADQVWAWNLRTGKPAWPSDQTAKNNLQDAVIYPSVKAAISNLPTAPFEAAPRYTLTVNGGRLFARLGDPTLHPREELRDNSSFVVCLELDRGEGKLVWKLDADSPDAIFAGSPLVVDGRAYAVIRKGRPQMLTEVICFDAETKQRRWERSVCATVPNLGQGEGSASSELLTAGDDAVFLSTGDGAIAALEADGGAIRWVVTYEGGPAEAGTSPRARSGIAACLFSDNKVFVAPRDADGVMAFESGSGTTLWQRSLSGGIDHLLGAKNGILIASGEGLWGLSLATGSVQWHVGYSDPLGFGYGRGILAGNVVYWPTREEIFVVDQATGAIRRRIPVSSRDGEKAGNLILAGDSLVVAQPRRIAVYGLEAGSLQRSQELSAQRLRPPYLTWNAK
jgi:outer membrane protein assembly factor BamB